MGSWQTEAHGLKMSCCLFLYHQKGKYDFQIVKRLLKKKTKQRKIVCGPQYLKYLLSSPSQKKFANPCNKQSIEYDFS